jgi:hypothetical protein
MMVGRKSKYNEDFPLLVLGYARQGLTDEKIGQKLGISKDTFYIYCKKYPEFSDALKQGKAPVDFEVENQLLKRARGYRTKETKTIALTTPAELNRAKEGGLEVKNIVLRQEITEKEIAPDVTAQIFWLKNRKPANWRDRIFNEVSGNLSFNIEDIQDSMEDD